MQPVPDASTVPEGQVFFSRIAGFRGAAQSQILAERLHAQDVLALRQSGVTFLLESKVQTQSGTHKLISKLADCFTPSSLESLAPPATAIEGYGW